MESNSARHGVEGVLHEIDAVEKQVAAHLAAANKLKTRLVMAKKAIAKASPVTHLRSLIADLKAMPKATAPDSLQLAAELERLLHPLLESHGTNFKSNLHDQCELHHVSFRLMADSIGVGPFALTIDPVKESAALAYAKAPFAKDLPLDAAKIVEAVSELSEKLLQPTSYSVLKSQLEEAMKVSLTRQRKPLPHGELRAELPAVYREMAFIRQGHAGMAASQYSLSKFVVDLKTLIQSTENTSGDRRFRLETAVLENAKDQDESGFVPKDLAVGYGEGTYYQAIVLTAPA